MRILILDTFYEPVLHQAYAQDAALSRASYETQWRRLMDLRFGTSNAYSHFLGVLGHQAHEVIGNADCLQSTWARERGARDQRRDAVLAAQIDEFSPDVVYVQNMNWFSEDILNHAHARGALVVGQIASEAPRAERLRRFDLITTSFPHFVELFESFGVPSAYFRIGFDPRVLESLPTNVLRSHDVVFVGSLSRRRWTEGNKTIERAARKLPIEFWGYGVKNRPPWSPMKRRYRGEAWGMDMYRVLQSAKIALNRHIGASAGYANNMRLFEATGVGALLITDAKRNLDDLFEVGNEVVTYTNTDDLIDKVRFYLGHDEERAAISAAGQSRVLNTHSYEQRMKELVPILEKAL